MEHLTPIFSIYVVSFQVTSTPILVPVVTPAKSTKKGVYADISLYSDLPPTPQGSGEMIVSPLVHSGRPSTVLTPKLYGMREMMRTPKQQASPRLVGVRELMATPKQGKTPRSRSSPQLAGVRQMMSSPQQLASPRLAGVKNLLRTPKSQSSPQLAGLDELWKTPRVMTSPVTVTTQPERRGRKRALSGAATTESKKRKVASSPPGDVSVEDPLSRTTKMESVVVSTEQQEGKRGGSRRLTKLQVKAARRSEVAIATVKITEVASTRVRLQLPLCD